MQFTHIIIIPLIILLFSFLLQNWVKKDEFSQFCKLYFIGIVSGLIICFVFSFFNPIFNGKANHLTIFLKSLFIDGFFFSVIVIIGFYFIIDFFCDMSISTDWSMTTILTFFYICGIYTIIDIIQVSTQNYPSSFLPYLSFIPFLIFVSIIIGYGIPKYLDSYELTEKIIWGGFTVGIPILSFTFYSYFRFYDYILHYFFIVPFVISAAIFEIKEFNQFR